MLLSPSLKCSFMVVQSISANDANIHERINMVVKSNVAVRYKERQMGKASMLPRIVPKHLAQGWISFPRNRMVRACSLCSISRIKDLRSCGVFITTKNVIDSYKSWLGKVGRFLFRYCMLNYWSGGRFISQRSRYSQHLFWFPTPLTLKTVKHLYEKTKWKSPWTIDEVFL